MLQFYRGDCGGTSTLMFRQACDGGILVALRSDQVRTRRPLEIAMTDTTDNCYSAVLKICAIGES